MNHIRLVDEADDPHLSLALGTGKGVGLIDFSDKWPVSLINGSAHRNWKLRCMFFKRVMLTSLVVPLLTACALGPNPNPGERSTFNALSGGRYSRALSILEPAARQGRPWAQYWLATLHEYGIGVDKDLSKAIGLYLAVAKKWGEDPWSKGDMLGDPMFGNPGYFDQNLYALIAQYKLAELYFKGDYIAQDLVRASLLLRNVQKTREGKDFRISCAYCEPQVISLSTVARSPLRI